MRFAGYRRGRTSVYVRVTVHAPEFDASLSVFLPVPFSYACSRVERRSVAARDLSLFVCCCFALVAIRLLFC